MPPKQKLLTITEMNKLKNIHPGEVLMEEFLIPLEISVSIPVKVYHRFRTKVYH